MIRRSFRIGLWVGLLMGIGVALVKILRPKPEHSAVIDLGSTTQHGAHDWPPLEAAVATPTPVPVPDPDVEPVVASDEPGLVTIGDEPLEQAGPQPEPVSKPAAKKPAAKKPAEKRAAPRKKLEPWIDPDGNVCPETHPVKGKLSSMIFQVPGNFAYDRTKPDRCYESADAAAADGLRPAKR